MDITDIRIRKVESEGKLKAYVTLTFDGCFVVHNLKIISGQAGTFVAMPSRKTNKGEYKDIAHPINSDFRNIIQQKILEEYHKLDEPEGEREAPRTDELRGESELEEASAQEAKPAPAESSGESIVGANGPEVEQPKQTNEEQ
jgi:stage V sporulation protein G